MKSGPHLPQIEKALAQKQRLNATKNKKQINKTIPLKKKKNKFEMEQNRTVSWTNMVVTINLIHFHKQS